MIVTKEHIKTICPTATEKNILKYLDFINKYAEQYEINKNKNRMSAFLSNILHESGSLHYNKEIASGSAYEGRKDLGNTQAGDGVKFKGRGLIQLTGRANYTNFAKFSGIDCVNKPELIETPEMSVLTAVWFWDRNGLNSIADSGDFKKVCKRVNGGFNGFEERQKYYNIALNLF